MIPGKELLKLRIEMVQQELDHMKAEYRRMNAGEDPFGEPGSISESEKAFLTKKQDDAEKREMFEKVGDKDFINDVLARLTG